MCKYGHLYRADCETPKDLEEVKWHPSIHMPRRLCRLLLEITEIRVQRLHDISDEDAVEEGSETSMHFAHLWNDINGKRAPWDSNPWVWALTFRRVS